jgi:uroporphyrinogen-III synthase
MRALITRPEEDAAPLAEALAERRVEVMVEPLLVIRVLDDVAVDLDGVQALLFTSANGVRAFAARSARRDIGVLAVGDASATAAREAGFKHIESAGGDVGDLVRLIKARLDPRAGALFHAAGSVVAGDLAGQLAEAGYQLRRVMLYEAKPADALSPETLAALADRSIDLVLFFSPRTATTFVELVRKAADPRVTAGCAVATALCLSPAVAKAAGAITWKSVRNAEKPDLPALLSLVDAAVEPVPLPAAEPVPMPTSSASAETVATPPVPPLPARPPAPVARSGGGAVIAAVVAAAIVAVVAVASESLWRPYLAAFIPTPTVPAPTPDPALAQRLDALESQAAELGQRLAAIDGAVNQLDARGAGAGTDMADLSGRVEAISRETTALRHDLDAVLAQPMPDTQGGTPGPAAIPDEIARLPEDVAALRQRLDEVAAAAATEGGPSPETTTALDTLRRQVDALDTAANSFDAWIGTVESRLEAVEALEGRIAALEQASSSAGDRATGNAALALAVNQLQAALAGQRSFVAELAALSEVAAGDPEAGALSAAIATLTPQAETGVPTLAELRAGFPAIARAVVAAARAEAAANAVAEAAPGTESETTPGWLDAAMLKLSELVSVRPVGEDVEGEDAAARVARAEAALAKGDLSGAVAELGGLTGKAAEAAAPWQADARARLDAEAALAALQSIAVARLAPAGSGG